jgi:hypothetical protein
MAWAGCPLLAFPLVLGGRLACVNAGMDLAEGAEGRE